jgi:hypothetical protein
MLHIWKIFVVLTLIESIDYVCGKVFVIVGGQNHDLFVRCDRIRSKCYGTSDSRLATKFDKYNSKVAWSHYRFYYVFYQNIRMINTDQCLSVNTVDVYLDKCSDNWNGIWNEGTMTTRNGRTIRWDGGNVFPPNNP